MRELVGFGKEGAEKVAVAWYPKTRAPKPLQGPFLEGHVYLPMVPRTPFPQGSVG
jgi:hypothetical protein